MNGELIFFVRVLGDLGFAVVLLLLPFALFRRTRIFAGTIISYCSFAVGLSYWVDCVRITYSVFGIWTSILGIALAGAGVVLTALIALLWIHEWASFAWFLLGAVLIIAMRVGGVMVAAQGKDERARKREELLRQAPKTIPLNEAGSEGLKKYLREIGQTR